MEAAKIPDSKTNWDTVDIFLFSNGQQNSPPRKYHLTTEDLDMWPITLRFLARTHYGGTHSEIQLFTINGELVGPMQLTNGSTYVAVQPPDCFIQAGYETYLLKASRSWEKRQAKITSYCNLCSAANNELNGTQPDDDIAKVLSNEEKTSDNVEKTKAETRLRINLMKPELKTSQQAHSNIKVNNNKRKLSQLHTADFRHNHTKTVDNASNKNQNQSKNYIEKNRSKIIRKPTISYPIQRRVSKTPTAEKLKETVTSNFKFRTKTNANVKPMKDVDSSRITKSIPPNKTSIVSSNIDDDVKVLLATITDSVISSSTCTQHNNIVNNLASEHANTDNLMVIGVDSLRNETSVSKAISNANELDTLTIHEKHNNSVVSIKSSHNKYHNLFDGVCKTSSGERNFNENPNDAVVNETLKLEVLGSKRTEENTVISKTVSYNEDYKGDVINLLLRIKLKSNQEKKKYSEKESQVNIDMDFMVNSKTLQTLLDEDTEKDDNGSNPKVVVVQCTCNDSQNVNDKVINDKLQTYTVIIPILNCERCKSERQDLIEPDIPSNVLNKIESAQNLNENNIGDTKIVSRKESIKSQVNWLTDEINRRNGDDIIIEEEQVLHSTDQQEIEKEQFSYSIDKQDYLTIHKRIPKETTDNSSQTEWCNILLETRRREDGHYSFHLPTLKMLKSYKF